MGREIVYCSQCGVRILEKDLAAGRAFTVLDKVFCAECREKAFTQGPGPAPASAPASARSSAPPSLAERKATATAPRAPVQGIRPPSRPEGVQAPRTIVRKKNNTPVIVASLVGVLAMVVLIAVILSSGGSKTQAKGGPGETGDKTAGGSTAKLTPEEQAAKRLNDLHAFARSSSDPAAVVKKAVEAEKEIVGTPSEDGYRSFRKTWERKVAEGEAAKKIDGWLAEAKKISTADPEFKRYSEVLELLQKAEELAMTDFPDKVVDVKNFKKSLEEPYEAAADAWFEKMGDRIRTYMREGDNKAALSLIVRFPEVLKLARVWRVNLTKMKDDCERAIAAEAARAAGKEVERPWTYFFNIGREDLGRKNYAKAKENLLKAEAKLPAWDKLTDQQKEAVTWGLYYNVGCIYGIEAKDLKDADKTKAVDEAFAYLKKAAEAGVFGTRCGEREHATAKDHWEKDKDLDSIRSDPRYAELIKQYAK